jgi:hypothetical protein
MSNRKYGVGSGKVLVSCWAAMLAYGCVAAPAENSPGDGGGNVSGTGAPTGGTATGGGAGVGMGGSLPTGGTATGGAATGGAAGAGVTGGATTGGAAGAGVTGGVATGGGAGAGVTGGVAGAPGGSSTGGTAGASSGGANSDAECKGIRSNMACTPEGKACPNMACGLGDMGRRDCNCATNWTCTSCSHVGTPIATKPANADTACAGVTVGAVCEASPDSPDSVCNPNMTAGNTIMEEYCMCASNPTQPADPPEWNCDDGPSSW